MGMSFHSLRNWQPGFSSKACLQPHSKSSTHSTLNDACISKILAWFYLSTSLYHKKSDGTCTFSTKGASFVFNFTDYSLYMLPDQRYTFSPGKTCDGMGLFMLWEKCGLFKFYKCIMWSNSIQWRDLEGRGLNRKNDVKKASRLPQQKPLNT